MQSQICSQLRRTTVAGATRLTCRPICLITRHRRARKTAVSVSARYSSGGSPGIVDRVVAALPYVLPYLDALMYGRYFFYMYPVVKSVAVQPFLPLMSLYQSLPFSSFLAFFGLYIGIVNNRSFSRFVRFNAVQAIILDIVLTLPRLLETVLTPPTSGWGVQAYIQSQSFVWIFITVWIVYGVASCLLGQWARIPFVADAADQQVR